MIPALLDPRVDFAFKMIFGQPETRDILAAFLNAVLGLEGAARLMAEDLELLNPNLDRRHREDKYAILDVRVRTASGEQMNVEIQLFDRHDMHLRSVYYCTRLFVGQLQSGQDYVELKKTIAIDILNFNLLPTLRYHSVYHLWEDRERHQLTDMLELHFLELPKVGKGRLDDPLVAWLLYLKGVEDPVLEMLAMNEPMLKRAREVQEALSRSAQMRAEYESRFKAMMDEQSLLTRLKRYEEREVKSDQALAQRDQALAQRDQALAQKDQVLAQQDQALAQKDQVVAQQEQALIEERQRSASLQAIAMRAILSARFGASAERLQALVLEASGRASTEELLTRLATVPTLEAAELLLREE